MVLLNAGAGIYLADRTDSLEEGIKMAADIIDSGLALEKLEKIRKLSRYLEQRSLSMCL